MWVTVTRIIDGALGNGLENDWKSWKSEEESRLRCWIVEIGQSTKESPGNMRRLVATQTPVKDNRLTVKAYNSNNNNNTR